MSEQENDDALLGGSVDGDCDEEYDEDALLADNTEENDENEVEDILELEADDEVDLDETFEETKINVSSSDIHSKVDDNSFQSNYEQNERVHRFTNERNTPTAKISPIPDTLDKVSVPDFKCNLVKPKVTKNKIRNTKGHYQNNQRFFKRNIKENATVHINPNFKGYVKVGNDARFVLNANKINKRAFIGEPNKNVAFIQPWASNIQVQNQEQVVSNAYQNSNFQPPPSGYNNLPNINPQFTLPPPPVQQSSHLLQSHNQTPFQPLGVPVNQNRTVIQMPISTPAPSRNVFLAPSFNYSNNNQNAPYTNSNNCPLNQPLPFNNANIMYSNQPPPFTPPQFQRPPPPLNCVPYNQQVIPEQNYSPFYANNNQIYTNPPPNDFTIQQQHPRDCNNFQQPGTENNMFNQNLFSKNNSGLGNTKKKGFNKGNGKFRMNSFDKNKRRLENKSLERRRKRPFEREKHLHEVPIDTQDIAVTSTEIREDAEEEDELTKDLRRKIEEQKRLREKILREKEERRKQAAKDKVTTIVDSTTSETNPIKIISSQNLPKNKRINQTSIPNNQNNFKHFQQNAQKPNFHRRQLSNSFQQTNNLQTIVPTTDNSVLKNTNASRVVVAQAREEDSPSSSFFSNRKVLARDESLPETSIVVVSNLAAGTTDVKLRKMCNNIGSIQKLQMSPKERLATIQFKSVASAHAFFKKYQRFMLDLSMIQVTLKQVP